MRQQTTPAASEQPATTTTTAATTESEPDAAAKTASAADVPACRSATCKRAPDVEPARPKLNRSLTLDGQQLHQANSFSAASSGQAGAPLPPPVAPPRVRKRPSVPILATSGATSGEQSPDAACQNWPPLAADQQTSCSPLVACQPEPSDVTGATSGCSEPARVPADGLSDSAEPASRQIETSVRPASTAFAAASLATAAAASVLPPAPASSGGKAGGASGFLAKLLGKFFFSSLVVAKLLVVQSISQAEPLPSRPDR